MEKIKLDFCRTLTDRGNVYFECVDNNNLTGDYYRAADVDALLSDVRALVEAAEKYKFICGIPVSQNDIERYSVATKLYNELGQAISAAKSETPIKRDCE